MTLKTTALVNTFLLSTEECATREIAAKDISDATARLLATRHKDQGTNLALLAKGKTFEIQPFREEVLELTDLTDQDALLNWLDLLEWLIND